MVPLGYFTNVNVTICESDGILNLNSAWTTKPNILTYYGIFGIRMKDDFSHTPPKHTLISNF